MEKTLFVLFTLVLIACLTLSVPRNSFAAEKWLVLGSTAWVAQGSNLVLDFPDIAPEDLRVRTTTAGSFWIMISPPLTLGSKIKGIALCYKTPNAGSYIHQIRLNEHVLGLSTNIEDLSPLPESSEGTCYLSSPFEHQLQGTLSLKLKLNFANASDSLVIGGLGILVDE